MLISEITLLRKMELSEKVPRKMLCARKSALGASLMKPSAIALTLVMKLYVGHARANDRLANCMQTNRENEIFYNTCNRTILKALPRSQHRAKS